MRERQRDGRQSVAAASDVASLLSLAMRHAQRRLRLAAGFVVEHWLAQFATELLLKSHTHLGGRASSISFT